MKDITSIKLEIDKNSLLYLPQADNNISLIIKNLRTLANEEDIKNNQVLIPDKCEKYGFAEGSHNLENLLLFLADMLEE
jgi:hypothetical protein